MNSFFTTEQISKYHPDKYADQISDLILTEALRQDPNARVGIETMVKDFTVVLGGEIKTIAKLEYWDLVHQVAKDLNYQVHNVINLIGVQSHEINKAVQNRHGNKALTAGDQGLMFGYASSETESYLPYGFDIANRVIKTIEDNVGNFEMFKGDAKTQVSTGQDGKLDTVLISCCHQDDVSLRELTTALQDLFPDFADKLIVNPAGRWTLGGPNADCGLTGRKIVCDQYGGYAPVGGGAFSGKDPSKVDRSASYMARYIAVQLLKQLGGKEAKVQLGYGIGLENPVFVSAYVDNKCQTNKVKDFFDLTPQGMIDLLGLTKVDYYKVARGCHYYDPSGLTF